MQTAALRGVGQLRRLLAGQRAERDHIVNRLRRLAEPIGGIDWITPATDSRSINRLARVLEATEHIFADAVGTRHDAWRSGRLCSVGLHIVPGYLKTATEGGKVTDFLGAHRLAGSHKPRHRGPFAAEIFAHDPDEVLEILQARQAGLDVVLLHRRGDTKSLARGDERGNGRGPLRYDRLLARACRLGELGIRARPKGHDLLVRALHAGDELIAIGEVPCGQANQRLLEWLVAEFAKACNRRLLGVRWGGGRVERQIGRAALAGPLASALQQHVGGFVDRGRVRSRCALEARIAQDISGDANAKEGQQRDRGDKKIANTPNGSAWRGRVDCGHFLYPYSGAELPSSNVVQTAQT